MSFPERTVQAAELPAFDTQPADSPDLRCMWVPDVEHPEQMIAVWTVIPDRVSSDWLIGADW